MSVTQRIKEFNSPLLLLCVAISLCVALAAGLVYQLQDKQREQWTVEYGQALANVAARRALDSTLNHDLVSLQVILSDVVENGSVVNATIHDVENNLLVQAGQRQAVTESARFVNFSSPITLHNSIAGYVTITLDTQFGVPFNSQVFWLFGLLAAVMVAMTLLYGYFSRGKIWELAKSEHTIPIVENTQELNEVDDSQPQHMTQNENDSQYNIDLVVALVNYQELESQLSGQAFRSLNQALEQQLSGVLALYSGVVQHADQGFIFISISSNESENDAVFKGLCASMLLQQLMQYSNAGYLHLNTMVIPQSNQRAILRNLPYHFNNVDDFKALLKEGGDNSILVAGELLDKETLAPRFECEQYGDYTDILRILNIGENYQQLLDRQRQQLTNV